ncbi:O-antigen ligase family protein [Aggregatilineales bacterium SYSU G02658]
MTNRRQTLERVLSPISVIYLLLLGGTWNGVLASQFQTLTLLLLGGAVVLWRVVRWRAGWMWHRTPLDGLLVLWGAAFAASVAANPETWRRSAEALWYMLLYVLVWYAIADTLANGMDRRAWLNAAALVGVIQLPIVVLQVVNFYSQGGTGLPRPVGLAGNPNLLGAYYVVFLPLAVTAWLEAQNRLARVVLGGYAVVTAIVLAATFSRGAWVGGAAAISMIGLFALVQHGITSPQSAWRAWHALTRRRRQQVVALSIVGLAGAVGLIVALLASINASGRGAELRTLLWQYAWEMFARQPLTGEGLFTYGYHLGSFWSIPPEQPHSHPHNLPLLVLSELGLLGGIVGVATVGVIAWSVRVAWPRLALNQRWPYAAAVSALVGSAAHHLLDTPMMMPAVALLIVLLAALVVVPHPSVPMQATWRKVGHPIGMGVLWAALLGVGVWQSGIIAQYNAMLADAVRAGNPSLAAQRLEQIIAQDPFNAAYRRQQAYLLGLAADRDPARLEAALSAYEFLHTLEPFYAVDFLNHAALRWQAGQQAEARALAAQAASIAPNWRLARDLAAYYDGEASSPPRRVESIYAPNTAYFQMLRFIIVAELLPQIERPTP